MHYQAQLKIQALREDGVDFKLSVVYSPADELPSLYFQCFKDQELIEDPSLIILKTDAQPVELSLMKPEKQNMFLTKKEHPIDQLMTWYLHECNLKGLLPPTENNRLFQWLSVVGNQLLGLP